MKYSLEWVKWKFDCDDAGITLICPYCFERLFVRHHVEFDEVLDEAIQHAEKKHDIGMTV